ncbi:Fe-S-containing hydro-lyase [candidate division KSB1 bacterium]|nr:Fe-S-containing hydro-lyase [candidate division KSB1 bacterium]
MSIHKIQTPLKDSELQKLKIGDSVLLSGTIYTARDSAHQRLIQMLKAKETLPFDLKDQVLFYAGPAPAPPGKPVGSIGPTTACRMDSYTLPLLDIGLKGMIGKGARNQTVRMAMQKHSAVYFAAIGGIAALLARCIKSSKIIAFEDLGPEAIRQLEVVNLPVIVVNDVLGGDLYEEGVFKFKKN